MAASKTAEEAAKKATRDVEKKKATEEAAKDTGEECVSLPTRLAYTVSGRHFPVVSMTLDESQSIYTQSDVMVWMTDGISINTNTRNDGALFMATYASAANDREVGIASRVPWRDSNYQY